MEWHARRRHDRGGAARTAETDSGDPLPGRDLIVFFAFAVVLATLVVQGLSMPSVIRTLRLEADDGDAEAEEALARVSVRRGGARAARRARGRGLGARRYGRARARRLPLPHRPLHARIDPDGDGKIEKRSLKYQRLRRELLDVERQAVVELRNAGEISDVVMRKVERDLDLEVSRLDA